jgi:FkbM family methyltransferase
MNNLKNILRKILMILHIDLTQNLRYDRLTDTIMKKFLRPNSNCIDIGCHKGEILEKILYHSPKGCHFAFEPIPDMYQSLQSRFGNTAKIFPYALGDTSDNKVTFNIVTNAPAYSGLRQRSYDDLPEAQIKQIEVDERRLDDVLSEGVHIDFIKIDVEGGDYNVLKGAERIIKENNPLIIFEFGIGGADHYGITPTDLYNLLSNQYNYGIYTLDGYLKARPPLSEETLHRLFYEGKEYYFAASPRMPIDK